MMASTQNIDNVQNVEESNESDETLNLDDKRVEEIPDGVEDDMELKWEDDDVDDVSITNEDALLEDVTMDKTDDALPVESKKESEYSPASNIDDISSNKCTESDVPSPFEPAKGHGLNKPDMMLEILTENLSDLIDDDELTNLKMSPDIKMKESNNDKEESLNPNLTQNPETEAEIDEAGQRNDELLQENTSDGVEDDMDIELCEEGNLAADLLTKEITMTNESIGDNQIDENLLLGDDIENEQEDDPIEELDLLNDKKDCNTIKITEIPNSEVNIVTNEQEDLIQSLESKIVAPDSENNSDSKAEAKIDKETSETTSMNDTKIIDSDDNLHMEEIKVQESSSNNCSPRKSLSLKQKSVNPKPTEPETSAEDHSALDPDKKEISSIDNLTTEPQPSTSGLGKEQIIIVDTLSELIVTNPTSICVQNESVLSPAEEVPEMTDSLDLLAESSRMTGDDEVEDDELDYEEAEDFEPFDDSSNQMTAEHSEDSDPHNSENMNEIATPTIENDFTFTITDVVTEKIVDETDIEKMQEEDKPETAQSVSEQSTAELVDISDTDSKDNDGGNILNNLLNCISVQDNKEVRVNNEDEYNDGGQEGIQSEETMSFVDLEESSEEDGQDAKNIQTEIESNEISMDVVDEMQDVKMAIGEGMVMEQIVSEAESFKDAEQSPDAGTKIKCAQGLEVFTLDSDEEAVQDDVQKQETGTTESPPKPKAASPPVVKCINKSCDRTCTDYYVADGTTVNYYDTERKKRRYVCQKCQTAVEERNQLLITGIRSLVPLMQLDPDRPTDDLVEISDSESEEEPEPAEADVTTLGEEGARFIEENLGDAVNETWLKFDMDARLQEAQEQLQKEVEQLQKDSYEINQVLDECQVTTDRIRTELYSSFECDIKELPALVIYDVPNCSYTCIDPSGMGSRLLKRRQSSISESPAKRYALTLDDQMVKFEDFANVKMEDENPDVSVVHLSVESAPPDLPPAGDVSHPPMKVGMTVYAAKNALGSWMRAKIVEITPKAGPNMFTLCRVKYEYKQSKPTKILPARCLAYSEPPDVRMTIGTRVIALFKDVTMRESFYPGIVAEIPNPVNNYRYLIFFDDGYSQYAPHSKTRLVCECSSHVWEEVQPKSRDFVRKYLLAYPERPMVRLHPGQSLKTEWRDSWWSSVVVSVDASLVEVLFLQQERREWIYRGSTRLAPLYLELQAAERHRPRALPRSQPQSRINMPYVVYTRSEEQTDKQTESSPQQHEELRRQRAVAKKSTTEARAAPPAPASQDPDGQTSRVVYYTPKKQVKPLKMVPHTCSPKCRRTDVLALKELRTYNPLAKPLLSGWERQIVRFKGHKAVSYVSPCGRRVRCARELHAYLRAVCADLPLDLFDFSPSTHCLAEFVLDKCYVGKKDLSHGKENVPVPCVNYYDESLPEFCSYNTERTPTAGVPLNLDPEFLCGCDCEDDCEDKTKCACWKLTLEGARTIGLEGDVGYVYKRLPEPLPSGIYECNSRCKCKDTCLNRVAQHPLQLKLQVFKTHNRGWGIRALNDIPKGAFVCVYAGNLLTDATANLDGLNEGDEYLAELDYIEVVEQMKEGYEEDIPENIRKLDEVELAKQQLVPGDELDSSSSEEDSSNKNGEEDDDFRPGYIGLGHGVTEFNKRLRRRNSKMDNEKDKLMQKDKKEEIKLEIKIEDEDCITISDDEEVREPSNFTAAAGMGANEFKSKYRSVRTLFGEDEACYIMDAKVQGNIGRYLNHSCVPNVFVQNVFVDTHDPRFPWVAFFALRPVRAGIELTWNYNYDVGSVPGKVLYCYCGAPTCRGRLL